jgi:hypothetical protein
MLKNIMSIDTHADSNKNHLQIKVKNIMLEVKGRGSVPPNRSAKNKENHLSRYTGPRLKVMRALGMELPGLSRKSMENRNYPPGQHGQKGRRLSDYAVRLMEKQKLRFNYACRNAKSRFCSRRPRRPMARPGGICSKCLSGASIIWYFAPVLHPLQPPLASLSAIVM